MKIRLRVLAPPDAKASLRRDDVLAAVVDLDAVVFELDDESPLFDRFLACSGDAEGCWLNPVTTFTPKEVAGVRLFQPECRKLLREGPGDWEANTARLVSRPLEEIGGFRARTLDRIALNRAGLRPNEVACAGDWMAEWVIARGVATVFEEAGLSGFDLGPVYRPRTGEEYEDVFLLRAGARMPPAADDLTTPALPPSDPEGGRRQLSCLTYDPAAFDAGADFRRTAEAWSSNLMSVMLVSARVREVFLERSLRGWAFRPVLERGSPLHDAYLRRWTALLARVARSNPRHHF